MNIDISIRSIIRDDKQLVDVSVTERSTETGTVDYSLSFDDVAAAAQFISDFAAAEFESAFLTEYFD